MRTWRKIESSILTSARLSQVSDSAKWLFTLLVVAQDDEGKYPWTKPRIQALIATTDWDSVVSESLLSELRNAGIAELREGYIYLTNGAKKNGTPANSKNFPVLYPPIADVGTESLTSRERIGNDSIEKSKSRVEIEKIYPDPFSEGTGFAGNPEDVRRKPRTDQQSKQADSVESFELPDWVSPELWEGFMETRRKARPSAAATVRAKRLLITALEKLRAEGHDPKAVIEQSIRNGWKDVFPLRSNESNSNRARGATRPPFTNANLATSYSFRSRQEGDEATIQ